MLENGLYRLYEGGRMRMIIHTHVDDLLVARDGSEEAGKAIEALRVDLYLKGGVASQF